jgi:hypothetical protein
LGMAGPFCGLLRDEPSLLTADGAEAAASVMPLVEYL